MKKTFLFSLAFLACICLPAQQIQNVTAEQQGKNIVVSYNLAAASGQFDVALYCSTDGGTNFGNPLNAVTGDVGKNLNAGNNKQITWNVLADMEKLTGSRIVFEVRARTTSDLGIEMVFVKGGTFNMGSNNGGDDEEPAHMVRLHDFYMGKYEVTQKQWREVMGASTTLSDPAYFKNCDNCPVEQISWNDVQEFIKKLNQKTGRTYRLPTEAEWEYAAGGGSSRQKWAGTNSENDLERYAWYKGNGGGKTHAVGTKKPNFLGIYDMSGNVWEWCSDWYGNYNSDNQTNPNGPSSGSYRVLRGGSWSNEPQRCRVANRGSDLPGSGDIVFGFRLALVP
jgi:formylglycine-generating enzyme required for sulfatase activity